MSDISIPFCDIAKQARSLAASNERVAWDMALLNALVVPLTLGSFCFDTTDHSKSKADPIPDEWLQAVAGLPDISKEGLSFLADRLASKGYVSVHDAVSFLEIEKREMRKRQAAQGVEKKRGSQSAGAALVLARAEKELPGTIDRLVGGAKDVVQAASGAAAFVAEKSVWVGKGLGSLAEAAKAIRKS